MRSIRLVGAALSFTTAAMVPLVSPLTAPLAAQQRPQNRIALEQYLDWEDVQTPQLSPDGSQILFTRRWVDKMNDKWESSIWLMNADGTHQRSLVQGSDVQWSPDGKRIAYIAKGDPSRPADLRALDGRRGRGHTDLASHRDAVGGRWAPDGKSLAFDMNVPVNDSWHINMPAAAERREVDGSAEGRHAAQLSAPIASATPTMRTSTSSSFPPDGGTARQITNGDWNHSAPAFSADGKWIAFSRLRESNAEHVFRHSRRSTPRTSRPAISSS